VFAQKKLSDAHVASIMHIRQMVNIGSRMLEPPQYLWEEPEHERLFKEVEAVFAIKRRVQIMNRKLDIGDTHIQVISKYLSEKKGWATEIIIIALIATELFFLLANKSTRWQNITYWELIEAIPHLAGADIFK